MPIAIGLTCVVLWKWCRVNSTSKSILLGIAWSGIPIVCDYLLIVKLLSPPDGYYKFDVYLYYLITLVLPMAATRLRRGTFASLDSHSAAATRRFRA